MSSWQERMSTERARRIQASNDQAQKQSAALDADSNAVDLSLGILDRVGVLGMISDVRDEFWKAGEISDVSSVADNGKVRARYSQVETEARISTRSISLIYSYQEPGVRTGEPIYTKKFGFHKEVIVHDSSIYRSPDGYQYFPRTTEEHTVLGSYDELIGHGPSTIEWSMAYQTAVEIQVQRIKFKNVTKYYGHPEVRVHFHSSEGGYDDNTLYVDPGQIDDDVVRKFLEGKLTADLIVREQRKKFPHQIEERIRTKLEDLNRQIGK